MKGKFILYITVFYLLVLGQKHSERQQEEDRKDDENQ